MTLHTSKLQVRNSRTAPHIFYVEPWGEDFTLHPGESLEIDALGDKLVPSFVLVEWDDSTQIYCEEATTFEVKQQGVLLECGHNRQIA